VKAAMSLSAIAVPVAMVFLLVTHDGAIAQAGSTGGTLGKVNKSASGGEEERAASAHVRSAARTQAAPARSKASLAIYDGAWAGSSYGDCIINGWGWSVQIDRGIISGTNVTGKVSGAGDVNGVIVVFGTPYDFKGHLKSSQGSGTWLIRSGEKAGCVGTWTIVKS